MCDEDLNNYVSAESTNRKMEYYDDDGRPFEKENAPAPAVSPLPVRGNG